MRLIEITPDCYEGYSNVNRKYTICEFNFSDFDKELQTKLIVEADILAQKANPDAANNGKLRTLIQRTNDAYDGLLAEYAVEKLLNSFITNSATRPTVTTTLNQVDIVWQNPSMHASYNREVRSSFVKNGLPFALFATNEYDNSTYFNVLGPYFQKNYKIDYESTKDLYFRVLFTDKKMDVVNRFIKKDEPFYIIGAMGGKKIIKFNKHKSLTPGSAVQKHSNFTGDYFVCPLDKVGDIALFQEFFLNQ